MSQSGFTISPLVISNPRLEAIEVWPSRGLTWLQDERGVESILAHLDLLMSTYLTLDIPRTSNKYLAAVEGAFSEHPVYGQLLLDRIWFQRDSGTCHYLMTEDFLTTPGTEAVVGRRYFPARDPDDCFYQYCHEGPSSVSVVCNWTASGRHWHE